MSGINKSEYNYNTNEPFVELSTGFEYSIGKNFRLGLSFDYHKSKDFDVDLADFKAYNGFKISLISTFIF
jgi:hypothetical protein